MRLYKKVCTAPVNVSIFWGTKVLIDDKFQNKLSTFCQYRRGGYEIYHIVAMFEEHCS